MSFTLSKGQMLVRVWLIQTQMSDTRTCPRTTSESSSSTELVSSLGAKRSSTSANLLYNCGWWRRAGGLHTSGDHPSALLQAGCSAVDPWVILSPFGDGLREAVGWRRISALLAFLLAIPGALLVQIVVAVVAILALIPWPRLREALSGLLLTLTGTLGDSYVLIECPVRSLLERRTRQWVRHDVRIRIRRR